MDNQSISIVCSALGSSRQCDLNALVANLHFGVAEGSLYMHADFEPSKFNLVDASTRPNEKADLLADL